MELIGWLGAVLLASCGIPELVSSLETGNVGITWGMLIMWWLGEVFAGIYAVKKNKQVKLLPLLFNYGLNIIIITILIGIKYV